MEKGTPHWKLARVKLLIDSGRVRVTKAAREGATALGLDFDGLCGVVRSLSSRDFYKSMTTYGDHRAWQDVYRPASHQRAV